MKFSQYFARGRETHQSGHGRAAISAIPSFFSRAKMQLEVGILMRRFSYDES